MRIEWGQRPRLKPWGTLAGASAHLDQGGAKPVLVIVHGLHVGPALVLSPGPLLSLWLLPGLCSVLGPPIFCLPVLQPDPLGLRLSQDIAIRVCCLSFPVELLLPFGF